MTGKEKFNFIMKLLIKNNDLTSCDFVGFDKETMDLYYSQADKIDENLLQTYALGTKEGFRIITDTFGIQELSEYFGRYRVDKVACVVCGDLTNKLGTKLCDRCWELKSRIERNPDLARKILKEIDRGHDEKIS